MAFGQGLGRSPADEWLAQVLPRILRGRLIRWSKNSVTTLPSE
jgi:hypothetical protein